MDKIKQTLLVIEDDISIRRFLKNALLSQGYLFLEASSAMEGIDLAEKHSPDTILLDLNLPDINGLEVVKRLRIWTATPIIIISALDQEQDKVAALNAGADDYLTKPFGIHELNARIRVALRHAVHIDAIETPIFNNGSLKVDLIKRLVWVDEKPISLSPIQFTILALLARNADKIVTHEKLLQAVWGNEHIKDPEHLRVYIHQLRHKLEKVPAHPRHLQTEPGVGYRLIGNIETQETK